MWEEEFDLNSVRLCFQASITLPTGELFPMEPVVSQPIYDNRELATNTHTHTHVHMQFIIVQFNVGLLMGSIKLSPGLFGSVS